MPGDSGVIHSVTSLFYSNGLVMWNSLRGTTRFKKYILWLRDVGQKGGQRQLTLKGTSTPLSMLRDVCVYYERNPPMSF